VTGDAFSHVYRLSGLFVELNTVMDGAEIKSNKDSEESRYKEHPKALLYL
jgi:hypothetical protein